MHKAILEPHEIPTTGDNTPAGSLFRYVWRMSGAHQVAACFIALLVAGLSMAPLELQRRLIDDALRNEDVELLFVLSSIYLGVLLVQALLKFLLRMYQSWLSESAIRYSRQHLAGIYECRGAGRRDDDDGDGDGDGDGNVVSVVGTEVDKLGGFVGDGLSQPAVNLGMLLAIGGYMMVVEPVIALLSLAFLIPQAIAVPLVQRFINALTEERLGLLRSLSDDLVELPQDCSDPEEIGLGSRLTAIYGNRMRIFLLKFSLKAGVNLLNNLAPLAALFVGGYLVIQGETSVGVVVAFISGFDRLADPLRELIAYYRYAAQANVQHRMIASWMS